MAMVIANIDGKSLGSGTADQKFFLSQSIAREY